MYVQYSVFITILFDAYRRAQSARQQHEVAEDINLTHFCILHPSFIWNPMLIHSVKRVVNLHPDGTPGTTDCQKLFPTLL
jgi:hypothetical protein